MKKTWMRILWIVTLAVFCAVTVFAAAEDTDTNELRNRVLTAKSFKFFHHKEGLGLGDCPVYLAPSESALRLANNRQAVDTNEELYDGGKTEDGWLLVRYDTGTGKIRCGYIPPKYVKGVVSQTTCKDFDYIPAIAAGVIPVTDNCVKGGAVFTTLNPGDAFHILAKYTYHMDWWYIECEAEGKTARGFIDRKTASFYLGDSADGTVYTLETLGSPDRSPLGTEKTGEILVKGDAKDERKSVHVEPDANSASKTVVYPTKTYACYGTQTGKDGKDWYYVFVEPDSMWGWVRASYADFTD